MVVAGTTLRSLPAAAVMLVGNTVSRFAWPEYVLFAIVYSLIVFVGQFPGTPKIDPRIFSRQNARPLPVIIAVHIAFLAVFLVCMWMASSHLAQMPVWMTAKDLMNPSRYSGRKVSLIELLLVLAAVILRTIELPCIYAESKTAGPITYEKP